MAASIARTFVRVEVAPELLPCPACRAVTRAQPILEGVEVVHCGRCGKLLRRRRALTAEQRAQSLALRWAAAQLESDPGVLMVSRRRKSRGGPDELQAMGKLVAADQLRQWARTIHKRPPLREAGPLTDMRGQRAAETGDKVSG